MAWLMVHRIIPFYFHLTLKKISNFSKIPKNSLKKFDGSNHQTFLSLGIDSRSHHHAYHGKII